MNDQNLSILTALQDKTLLLIGSTGFLGTAFIEKLLRYSSNLQKIYILIRAASEAEAKSRFQNEVLHSTAFDVFRSFANTHLANALTKVEVVRGDVTQPELGLSPLNRVRIQSELDIVINCAASVDFQANLSESYKSNFCSVKYIKEFIKAKPSIQLLHISTAYVCGLNKGLILEAPSTPRHKSHETHNFSQIIDKLISAIQVEENLNGHFEVRRNAQKFANSFGFADGYTLTKWCAEQLLFHDDEIKKRCVIIRPSIIESSFLEPQPGWIEGFKVADPVILSVGTGTIKHFCGNPNLPLDVIPVDFVVNCIFIGIALGTDYSQNRANIPVLQVASSDQFPLMLHELSAIVLRTFGLRKRKLIPVVIQKFVLLAVLISVRRLILLLSFKSKKARRYLKKLDSYIKLNKLYAHYTSLDVRFSTSNLRHNFRLLPESEQDRFAISFTNDQWPHYLGNIHIPGLLWWIAGNNPKIMKLFAKKKAV